MINQELVDHLFRHQYGKMVSILTRLFGLSNLELIEDAVQDTFIQSVLKWRNQIPDNPEAWLTQAAKNRVVDLLRKTKADSERTTKINYGPSAISMNELFLDHEIEDSQLRMLFTACHPSLNPVDQIAFALKTISGFSTKEIASALLLKEDSIKKRLTRARKSIRENDVRFEIPGATELGERFDRVLEVVYLVFNEGFHSNQKEQLIRQDLCGEAARLCQLILKRTKFRSADSYSLYALICLHSARLDSKVGINGELIDLKTQDRAKWNKELVQLGESLLARATGFDQQTPYLLEAVIAATHTQAQRFSETNWDTVLFCYQQLQLLNPASSHLLNSAIVLLQQKKTSEAWTILQGLNPKDLEQRAYLYHATISEYYSLVGDKIEAIKFLEIAISLVRNKQEQQYLTNKLKNLRLKETS